MKPNKHLKHDKEFKERILLMSILTIEGNFSYIKEILLQTYCFRAAIKIGNQSIIYVNKHGATDESLDYQRKSHKPEGNCSSIRELQLNCLTVCMAESDVI